MILQGPLCSDMEVVAGKLEDTEVMVMFHCAGQRSALQIGGHSACEWHVWAAVAFSDIGHGAWSTATPTPSEAGGALGFECVERALPSNVLV